jgi:hypothetical protein
MVSAMGRRWFLYLSLSAFAVGAISFTLWKYVFVVVPNKCDEEVLYARSSPDGRWIAESNLEGCWMNASIYVTLHPAREKQDLNERIVWIGDTYSDGYSDAILHWIDNDHLEIGLPTDSSAEVGPTEHRGVHLRYAYFPNDAEERQKRSDFTGGRLTRDEWIKYRQAHTNFLSSQGNVTKIMPMQISYSFTESMDEYGTKWCYLDAHAIDGRFFESVEMRLAADVEKRGVAGFVAHFETSKPLVDSMRPLTLTGAQFIGSAFGNNPSAVFREKTSVSIAFATNEALEGFLTSFVKQPYSIAYIFDLPETIIQYEIGENPGNDLVTSFFECVGHAKVLGHLASDFRPNH